MFSLPPQLLINQENKMIRFFNEKFRARLSDGPILAILMITLTCLLTQGLMIPRLGYYYDDWYMLWSGASRGASSLIPLFSLDRPFMGVIYSLFYRLIGESIPGWHLFALLFRIAGGIAFYWILTLVWPKLKSLSILSAMLFAVFPGFLAEPNAATKINQLMGFSAALFSIAFSLQAVKTERRVWKNVCIGLSIFLMAFYLWIYEYMIGLEVMRIALLFWLQWQGERAQASAAARKVIRAYIPFVFVFAIFLIWRVFIFDSSRNATDVRGLALTYFSDFMSMVLRLIFQVIKDFFSASFFAWFVQPYHLLAAAEYQEIAAAFLVALIVVLLAVGYRFAVRPAQDAEPETGSAIVLVLIGSLTTLGAVFPVVLSNRSLDLMDAYKSYALHPSAGAMIIVIGLLLLFKPQFRKGILIGLLGLAVMTQSLNGQVWAKYWQIERNFWWQLTWRAPAIRNNALVIGVLPEGVTFREDYEIWGPLNLIYHPEREDYPLIQSQVLNQQTIPDVLARSFLEPHVRDIYVPRYYSNTLIISQPAIGSCIHVIDGKMPAYSANERAIVEKVGGLSDIEFIDPAGTPPVPPAAIFGREPEHGWCYYYQQASLARQIGDWRRIGELYTAAVTAGLKPADPSEYFVFFEGLVNLGRVEEARTIADNEINGNPAVKYSLCKSVSAAPNYPDSYGYDRKQIGMIVCE
jgi:hypothetical protein